MIKIKLKLIIIINLVIFIIIIIIHHFFPKILLMIYLDMDLDEIIYNYKKFITISL